MKKGMAAAFIALMVTIAVIGCGSSDPNEMGRVEYKEYGFTLEIPEGWQYEEAPALDVPEGTGLFFLDGDAIKGFALVTVFVIDECGISLKEALEVNRQVLREELGEDLKLEEKEIELDGVPAIRSEHLEELQGDTTKVIKVFAVKDNREYNISILLDPDDYEKDPGIFQEILEGFHFHPK